MFKQNVGHTKIYVGVGLDYLWLAMLVRMFIDMVVQVFLVSTVIITSQLSNPSPTLRVTFLKITILQDQGMTAKCNIEELWMVV